MIYVLAFNENIASHRLRLKAVLPLASAKANAEHDYGTFKPLRLSDLKKAFASSPADLCRALNKLSSRKNILLASKPFAAAKVISLAIAKLICGFYVIVDVSDNHLLELPKGLAKFLFWLKQYLVFSIADKVTCPSSELKQSLSNCREDKLSIIPDLLDIDSIPLDSPYVGFSPQRSKRFLWFGNCGLVSRDGIFRASESFNILVEFLYLLSKHTVSSSRCAQLELVISTNNSPVAMKSLEPYRTSFASLTCAEWSPASLKSLLAEAGGVILTYSSDPFSSTKSPNRLQASLASGLPSLVINPPPSCLDLLKELSFAGEATPVLFADLNKAADGFSFLANLSEAELPFPAWFHRHVLELFERRDAEIRATWSDLIRNL